MATAPPPAPTSGAAVSGAIFNMVCWFWGAGGNVIEGIEYEHGDSQHEHKTRSLVTLHLG